MSISKSDSTDEIFDRMTLSSGKGFVQADIARSLFAKRGRDLDEVAQQYIESGGTKKNMTIFVGKLEDITSDLIRKKNVEGLLWESRKTVFKIAESKNIPIHPSVLLDEPDLDPNRQHIGALLNFTLRGADDLTLTKESLRWANCLVEFFSGKPLFKEEKQPENIDIRIPKTLEQLLQAKANLGHPDQAQSEEEVIFNLWQQGFLQCKLVK